MEKKISLLVVLLVLIVSFTLENPFTSINVKAEEETTLTDSNYLSKDASNELKFRKEFGLDTKLSTIQNFMKTYEIGQYGVHLSPEEEENLSKRIAFQEKTNPELTKLLNDQFKDEYSIYIDQSNNGIYHIGLKKDVYDQQIVGKLIDSLFTDEYAYEIKLISNSEKDLDNVVDDILRNQSDLEKQDIIVNQVYTDVINEKVNVGIFNVSDDKIKLLQNIYGDVVYVHEAEDNVDDNRSTTVFCK